MYQLKQPAVSVMTSVEEVAEEAVDQYYEYGGEQALDKDKEDEEVKRKRPTLDNRSYLHPTLRQMYVGDVFRECYHGVGNYLWGHAQPANTIVEAETCKAAYQGSFYINDKEGYGTLSLGNGTVFEGLFKRNRPHGPGVATHPDGKQDVGLWLGSRIKRLCTALEGHVERIAVSPLARIKLLKFKKIIVIDEDERTFGTPRVDPLSATVDPPASYPHNRDPRSLFHDPAPFKDAMFYDQLSHAVTDSYVEVACGSSAMSGDKETRHSLSAGTPGDGEGDTLRLSRGSGEEAEPLEDDVRENNEGEDRLDDGRGFTPQMKTGDYLREGYELEIAARTGSQEESGSLGQTSRNGSAEVHHREGSGDDTLRKGSGDETLRKGSGDETLRKGSGDETFRKGSEEEEKSLRMATGGTISSQPKSATRRILATHLVAWNNEPECIDLLRHLFRYRRFEFGVFFNVNHVTGCERDKFDAPGPNEAITLRFLKSCTSRTAPPSHIYKMLATNAILPDTTDARGNTGVHLAAAADRGDLVALLVREGAAIDPANDEGFTPLTHCLARYLATVHRVKSWEAAFLPPMSGGDALYDAAVDLHNVWTPKDENFAPDGRYGSARRSIKDSSICVEKNYIFALTEIHAHSTAPVLSGKTAKRRGTVTAKRRGTLTVKRVPEFSRAEIKETRSILTKIQRTVATLLQCGADPDAGLVPLSALAMALFSGNSSLVSALLRHGANPSAPIFGYEGGVTALHLLALNQPTAEHVQMATMLLEHGANLAVEMEGHADLKKWLCRGQELKDDEVGRGLTPLEALLLRPDIKHHLESSFMSLLNLYFMSRTPGEADFLFGHSPLTLAMVRGNSFFLKYLLDTRLSDPNQVLGRELGVPLAVLLSAKFGETLTYNERIIMFDMLLQGGACPMHVFYLGRDCFRGNMIDFVGQEIATLEAVTGRLTKEQQARLNDQRKLAAHLMDRAREQVQRRVIFELVKRLHEAVRDTLIGPHRPDAVLDNLDHVIRGCGKNLTLPDVVQGIDMLLKYTQIPVTIGEALAMIEAVCVQNRLKVDKKAVKKKHALPYKIVQDVLDRWEPLLQRNKPGFAYLEYGYRTFKLSSLLALGTTNTESDHRIFVLPELDPDGNKYDVCYECLKNDVTCEECHVCGVVGFCSKKCVDANQARHDDIKHKCGAAFSLHTPGASQESSLKMGESLMAKLTGGGSAMDQKSVGENEEVVESEDEEEDEVEVESIDSEAEREAAREAAREAEMRAKREAAREILKGKVEAQVKIKREKEAMKEKEKEKKEAMKTKKDKGENVRGAKDRGGKKSMAEPNKGDSARDRTKKGVDDVKSLGKVSMDKKGQKAVVGTDSKTKDDKKGKTDVKGGKAGQIKKASGGDEGVTGLDASVMSTKPKVGAKGKDQAAGKGNIAKEKLGGKKVEYGVSATKNGVDKKVTKGVTLAEGGLAAGKAKGVTGGIALGKAVSKPNTKEAGTTEKGQAANKNKGEIRNTKIDVKNSKIPLTNTKSGMKTSKGAAVKNAKSAVGFKANAAGKNLVFKKSTVTNFKEKSGPGGKNLAFKQSDSRNLRETTLPPGHAQSRTVTDQKMPTSVSQFARHPQTGLRPYGYADTRDALAVETTGKRCYTEEYFPLYMQQKLFAFGNSMDSFPFDDMYSGCIILSGGEIIRRKRGTDNFTVV